MLRETVDSHTAHVRAHRYSLYRFCACLLKSWLVYSILINDLRLRSDHPAGGKSCPNIIAFPPRSASLSLIHLNLILIASRHCRSPWQSCKSHSRISFRPETFCWRTARLNYGLYSPYMAACGAALHFNRALVYSWGHTQGENPTVTLWVSPRDKNCFFNWNSRFSRQIRSDGLSKAQPCVTVIGKGQNKYW